MGITFNLPYRVGPSVCTKVNFVGSTDPLIAFSALVLALAWDACRSHKVRSNTTTTSVQLTLWTLRGDKIIVVCQQTRIYVMGHL